MKTRTALLLILQLTNVPAFAQQNQTQPQTPQQPPPRQPAPGKVFVQTPFGLMEVDAPGATTPANPNPQAPVAPTTQPAVQPAPAVPVATPAVPGAPAPV